jgi:hypothetical protein
MTARGDPRRDFDTTDAAILHVVLDQVLEKAIDVLNARFALGA